MIRFYAPDIEQTGVLPEVESGHCCRVLRLKVDDMVECVDGKGRSYTCRIVEASSKATKVEITDRRQEPNHWGEHVTLAVAPTKNIERIEWLLEKATEIGVNRIVLLRCARSERKDVRIERLQKILVSAMKQSMKAEMPELCGMTDFKSFVCENSKDLKFMGYCSESYPKKSMVKEYVPGKDVRILIGPEGDFSTEEVNLAVENGYEPVTFGNTRLRTETAALYALSAIHTINSCK